jgi:hypothetical protein
MALSVYCRKSCVGDMHLLSYVYHLSPTMIDDIQDLTYVRISFWAQYLLATAIPNHNRSSADDGLFLVRSSVSKKKDSS